MRDVGTIVGWTCVFCSVLILVTKVGAVVSEITGKSIVSIANEDAQRDFHVKRYNLSICCPNGSFSVQTYWCTPTENTSMSLELPPIYDAETLEPLAQSFRIRDFDVLWNSCQEFFREPLTLDEKDDYRLLDNGSVYSPQETLEYTNYCLAFYNTSDYGIVRCVDSVDESLDDYEPESANHAGMIIMFVLSLALRSLSFSALLVTLVVYSVVPELRNVHNATFRGCFGHVIFSNLVGLMRVTDLMQNMNTFVCLSYGFLTHFSNLAVFFSLNVLCFDMWQSFRSQSRSHKRASLVQSLREWRRNKLIMYSAYAWGCSSLIALLGLIMDVAPSSSTNFVRPEFDKDYKCFFKSTTSGVVYYYGPMGLVVICNTCFFVLAAVKITQRKKRKVDPLEANDCRHHEENMQRFNLYLKFFAVTLMNKTLNLIVWLCNYEPDYLYNLSSLYEHAQGILIFVILVWKDKTCQSLRNRQERNATGMRRRRGVTSLVQKCLWTRSTASEAEYT